LQRRFRSNSAAFPIQFNALRRAVFRSVFHIVRALSHLRNAHYARKAPCDNFRAKKFCAIEEKGGSRTEKSDRNIPLKL
jgi:hypothetical protein